jgi:hypothetical protein
VVRPPMNWLNRKDGDTDYLSFDIIDDTVVSPPPANDASILPRISLSGTTLAASPDL